MNKKKKLFSNKTRHRNRCDVEKKQILLFHLLITLFILNVEPFSHYVYFADMEESGILIGEFNICKLDQTLESQK